MELPTRTLVILAIEMAALAWLNEAPFGPHLRGLPLYAYIVGFYVYLLLFACLKKVDRTFFFGPNSKARGWSARPDGPRAARFLQGVLVFAALSLPYCAAPDATAEAVGLKSVFPVPVAFAIGFGAYGLLLTLFRVKERLRNRDLPGLRATLRGNRVIIPRDQRLLPAIVAALLINPFAEEFLLRGVLVHLVGTLTGWWIPAVAGGLVVTVILHAYQGRAMIAWHTAFYLAAVGLLFSDAGLWGAFGLHFAGDIVPLLLVRGTFSRLRRLRAERTYSTTPSLRSGQ